MLKAFKFLLAILLMTNICIADKIWADPNFPLLLKYPSKGRTERVFEIRFKLPVRSKEGVTNTASGIGYNQYIGIRFQDSLFSFSTLSPECTSLKSSTDSYSVSFASPASSGLSNQAANTNILYCLFKDATYPWLPASTTLTLTLTFDQAINISWIHNVSIFTSTSNNPDQLIIDNLPSLGSVGLYTDFASANNNRVIDINNGGGSNLATITSPASTTNDSTLYPGFTIDTRIIWEVNQFWVPDPNDYIFYVKFSTNNFNMPTSVSTEKFSDAANEGALASTLSFNEMTDGVLISGFSIGELYPKRKFKLVLSGMKTTDKSLGSNTEIALYVYYKNTYSIISYSTLNMDVVQKVQLESTVHHPEYFYMYDGMAWPFQFNIKSKVDFPTGGFVVIRHIGYSATANSVVLVASTCDFSETSFEQGFGKRWNCHPLRNDFRYDQSTGVDATANEGQGVYFKMPVVTANVDYAIKIWGFVEKCLGATTTKNYAASLAFSIRLFKYAWPNDSFKNEGVFFGNASNWVLAENLNVSITDKCFPLQTMTDITAAANSGLNVKMYDDMNRIPLLRNSAASTVDHNLPIGIEINNIQIVKPPTTIANLANFRINTVNSNFGNQWYTPQILDTTNQKLINQFNTSSYEKKYLFSSTTDLADTSFLMMAVFQSNFQQTLLKDAALGIDISTLQPSGTTNAQSSVPWQLIHYLPSECIAIDSTVGATSSANYLLTTKITSARIQWLFSRQFLTEKTSISTGCQVSWQVIDKYDALENISNTALWYGVSSNLKAGIDTHLSTITSAKIEAVVATPDTHIRNINMETSSTDLTNVNSATSATGTGKTFKITSEAIFNNDATQRKLSMIGHNCWVQVEPRVVASAGVDGDKKMMNAGQIGVYSDCFKWVTSSTVKSLYTYFEVQQVLLHNSLYPTRVWRFIKLFPELGIFQDPTNTDSTTVSSTSDVKIIGGNEKWMTAHYETTTETKAPWAVCIIEIGASFINAFKSNSNTLIIWLFSTSLLDMDVNNVTSQYPVAPVADTAYGHNSGQTISVVNRMIADTQNRFSVTTGANYPTITNSSGDGNGRYSHLEMLFMKNVVWSEWSAVATGTDEGHLNDAFAGGFDRRRTMYHFFMGSVIYIPTSSDNITGNTIYNLYIPFLCPTSTYATAFSAGTYPANGIYWTNPIATVGWATMGSYNNVTRIDRYVTPITSTTATTSKLGYSLETSFTDITYLRHYSVATPADTDPVTPIQLPLLRSPNDLGAIGGSNHNDANGRTQTLTDRMASFNSVYAKAYFEPYNQSTDNKDKKLTITTSASRDMSAVSIFLNSDIDTLSTSVTGVFPISTNPDNTLKVKVLTSDIYVLGKKYNRFLAYGRVYDSGVMQGNHPLVTPSTSSTGVFTVTDKIEITGIPRLAIEKLDSATTINPLDYVAVFSSRNTKKIGTNSFMLSNVLMVESTNTAYFVLWHPTTVVYESWEAVLSLDSSGNAIKDDKGGNFRITGTFKTEVPQGSNIRVALSASVVQSATVTICGLVENGRSNVVTDCTVASPNIDCKMSKRANNFDICCYNILNNNTTITASQGFLTLPFDSNVISTNLLPSSVTYANTWYQYPETTTSLNLASYNFSTRQVTDISNSSSAFYAKLENIKYSLSSTNTGYGMAEIQVDLPRNAVRGMTIEITADFSKIAIPNIKSRIVPVFGNSGLYGSSAEEGDIFLDSVYSNFDSSGLKLKVKNILYKCGLSLSTSLNIWLWPVLTYHYSSLDVSVAMKGPDSSSLASATSHTVTSTPDLTANPPETTIQTDFCSISNITPRIVDEYAEYEFLFKLSTFQNTLEQNTPNEVVIFFPYMYYGDWPEVECYNDTTELQCNYIAKSLLSIRFGSTIATTTDTDLTIKIVGLKNPYLATNNGVYFACSLNDTNYLTNTRNSIIRGVTTISEGIFPATDSVFGNIIFKNEHCRHTFTIPKSQTNSSGSTNEGQAVADEEPLNPRDDPPKVNPSYDSLHQFGFTLDIANNSINNWENGFNFTNSPMVYITFPADYKFSWYTFTPTAEIETYFMDTVDLSKVELNQNFLTVNTISVIGNQIRITFNYTSSTTIAFTKYFQYFKLKIFNLPPPVENTVDSTTGRITTEAFKFIFFNSDKSLIFRNWTNLNNFSNQDILTNKISDIVPQNKGFKYEFDQKKWIIDTINKDTQKLNEIICKSGRFTKYNFKVRTTSRFLKPSKVDIELNDAIFQLAESSYTIPTALNSDIPFWLGCSCGQQPGNWISRANLVKSSETNVYTIFMPLSPLKVQIKTDVKGIVSFIKENIVRINGSLFVDFTASEPPFINLDVTFQASSESLIENTKIEKGTLNTRTVMRITNSDASAIQSYAMGTPSNNCFEYQHDKINFTIDGVAAIIPNDALTASMFEYRNSLSDSELASNAVKFVFTTDYTQIYIYAVLTCYNDEFPTDENMKTQNITATNRLSYFSEILNIQGSANLVFGNLIRGVPYKLKVFIESTQGNRTLRTSSGIQVFNYTLTNGTTVDITATRTVSPLCASYRFVTRPGVQVTDPLLWYWQQKYSSGGYYEGGCITAVDHFGTPIPGLPDIKNEISCGRKNCRFVDRESYIVNQTSLDVSETYVVCAYPLSYCSVEPTNYDEKFSEILTELPTNNTFNDILNVKVVPEFTLTQVNDRIVPQNPSITNFQQTGNKVTFDAVATTPIICYTKTGDSAPNIADFDVCGSDCSVINLSSTSGSYSVNAQTTGGSVTLWSVCYNDMPCSSSNTGVISLGTYTPGNNNNNNGTNGNGTNPNGTNGNTTSIASWVSLNLLAFILISLVLLA